MSVDCSGVAEVFSTSVDNTVGIEEEFAILDPASLDLVPRYEELRDLGQADDVLAVAIAGELISSEIEIRSGRGENWADAQQLQVVARERLFALAEANGAALGASGTHPWADYRTQPNIDTEHYRRVVDGLQYVARRNNTFSLHVHVGVRDIDRAVAVCDRLRGVLPSLLAISANSPYLDGLDSGLHSARSQSFTKTFPRCGIPDAYGSWAAYREYIELLARTNSIVEYTQVWWSVRPHFAFGTVEVRICDVQATAAESDALGELIVACVAQAARDHDEGRPFTDPTRRLVEENFWRAIRHGLDGNMIDLDALVEYPSAACADRLLEWTAPVRGELGLSPVFGAQNGAQRQRAAIRSGASAADVYAEQVHATRASYARQETSA